MFLLYIDRISLVLVQELARAINIEYYERTSWISTTSKPSNHSDLIFLLSARVSLYAFSMQAGMKIIIDLSKPAG